MTYKCREAISIYHCMFMLVTLVRFFLLQMALLNVITLGPGETGNINLMITLTKYILRLSDCKKAKLVKRSLKYSSLNPNDKLNSDHISCS